MCDKELINKICDLSCSFSEINIAQDKINYDIEHPFKKYYKLDTIIAAINKYKNKEITDRFLAHWACLYNWIICGGFNDELIEEKGNSILELVKQLISDDLDALSFFYKEDEDMIEDYILGFKNLDEIYKTVNNWKGYYAPSEYADFNNDQYVLLVDDINKKFMIVYSDFIENGYEDEFLVFVSDDVLKNKIRELENNNYFMLSYSEQFYFDEK